MEVVRLAERDSPKGAENMGKHILTDLSGAAAWHRYTRGACRSRSPPLASADAARGSRGAGARCQVGTLKVQLIQAARAWESCSKWCFQ